MFSQLWFIDKLGISQFVLECMPVSVAAVITYALQIRYDMNRTRYEYLKVF